jgi:capsular polysaccharide biosynthesis protein
MTILDTPAQRTAHAVHGAPRSRVLTLWRLWTLVVVVAALVAGATYAVATAISPSYESSAQFRISVNEGAGLSQDALLASNSLTAQLVQLLPTDAVLAAPARQLGMSVSALRGALSVGSVAQQNLLQITASGPSAAAARRRAGTVADDFMTYMASDGTRQIGSYIHQVSSAIVSTNRTIRRLSASGGRLSGSLAGALAVNVKSEQALLIQLSQRARSAVPIVQEVQTAGAGSLVSPQPKLYAFIAFLVAAFLGAQAAQWVRRRQTSG